MGIENRPYVLNWRPGQTKIVQHTPDAVLYINGEVTLPGCAKCNGRVEVQRWVTDISVDTGIDASGTSASFTLSVPAASEDTFARDGNQIIQPGLEVEVFMRGYFPVAGLYSNLAEPRTNVTALPVPDQPVKPTEAESKPSSEIPEEQKKAEKSERKKNREARYAFRASEGKRVWGSAWDDPNFSKVVGVTGTVINLTNSVRVNVPPHVEQLIDQMVAALPASNRASRKEQAILVYTQFVQAGISPAFAFAAMNNVRFESAFNPLVVEDLIKGENRNAAGVNKTGVLRPGRRPNGIGLFQIDVNSGLGKPTPSFQGGKAAGTKQQVAANPDKYWDAQNPYLNIAREIAAIKKLYSKEATDPNLTIAQAYDIFYWSPLGGGYRSGGKKGAATTPGVQPTQTPESTNTEGVLVEKLPEASDNPTYTIEQGPSLLESMGLQSSGLEDLLAYPYYPVFRGVVTQTSHSWSAGVSTLTVTCASILHFWQYHLMSTNASFLGARPVNSKLQTSFVGHNFTGQHPYQIMYSLHNDMGGAAGGVAWFLSDLTAKQGFSSDQDNLYSFYIQYWEQRFAQREQKLRMHAANGDMFSAAQSAFLSRLSSFNLLKLLRNRFVGANATKDPSVKGLLERARSVGLTNSRRLDGLVLGTSRGDEGQTVEINMAEMFAFVNPGSVNVEFYESTYESKLDIAQAVCNITNFEFYQDVDGDLVFKPPMWNLDTSSSRVYRIEDIDIINLSEDTAEPEATYIKAKNPYLQNYGGHIMTPGDIGGHHIDYRLVAKYGWRPADIEVSHLSDAHSLRLFAAQKLDTLNVGIQSASLTIPIRPEIRPGYPVYIVHKDTFYYVRGVTHGFQPGGQSTTTLSLVAKRSKFFAPGLRDGTTGVSAIKLDQTYLPPRPLEVLDNAGTPRLAGFPNVVLALDPDNLNPLYFVTGLQTDLLDSPQKLGHLLKVGQQLGILRRESPTSDVYIMDVVAGTDSTGQQTPTTVRFYYGNNPPEETRQVDPVADPTKLDFSDSRFQTEWEVEEARARGTPVGLPQNPIIDIRKAMDDWSKTVKTATNALDTKKKQLDSQVAELARLRSLDAFAGVIPSNTGYATEIERLENNIRNLRDQIKADSIAFEATLDPATKTGVSYLMDMVKTIGQKYVSSNPDYPRLDSAVHLLSLLGDAKSNFGASSQPGYYRYYSASHPDPEHQGQPLFGYDASESEVVQKESSLVDSEYQGITVPTFVKEVVLPYPGAYRPETQLLPKTPVAGIRVYKGGRLRVVPTNVIQELTFSAQEVNTFKVASDHKTVFQVSGLGSELGPYIGSRFASADLGKVVESPKTLFQSTWDTLVAETTQAVNSIAYSVGLATEADLVAAANDRQPTDLEPAPIAVPQFKSFLFPEQLTVSKDLINTNASLSDYALADSFGQTILATPRYRVFGVAAFAKVLAGQIGVSFTSQFETNFQAWVLDLQRVGLSPEKVREAMSLFARTLSAKWGIAVSPQSKDTVVNTNAKVKTRAYSPVFPVSDEAGYEVVGHFRYGRGVSIDPDGVMAGLHAQDPLSLLSANLVEEIVEYFTRGAPVYRDVQTKEVNGVPVYEKVQVSGIQAVSTLEQKIIEQLRSKNLTDTQILDLFRASPGKNPNQLELGLQNMFANGMNSVERLTVTNAAKSLTDIKLSMTARTCNCKATEASVMLDGFLEGDFITPSGEDPTNQVVGAAKRAALQKGVAWKETQDNYVGKQSNPEPNTSIISSAIRRIT